MLTLSVNILFSFVSYTTSKELLERISDRLQLKEYLTVMHLHYKLFTTRKDPKSSRLDHINDVISMVEELAKIGSPITKKEVIMTILASLPPEYDPLIVRLDTMEIGSINLTMVKAEFSYEESRLLSKTIMRGRR